MFDIARFAGFRRPSSPISRATVKERRGSGQPIVFTRNPSLNQENIRRFLLNRESRADFQSQKTRQTSEKEYNRLVEIQNRFNKGLASFQEFSKYSGLQQELGSVYNKDVSQDILSIQYLNYLSQHRPLSHEETYNRAVYQSQVQRKLRLQAKGGFTPSQRFAREQSRDFRKQTLESANRAGLVLKEKGFQLQPQAGGFSSLPLEGYVQPASNVVVVPQSGSFTIYEYLKSKLPK